MEEFYPRQPLWNKLLTSNPHPSKNLTWSDLKQRWLYEAQKPWTNHQCSSLWRLLAYFDGSCQWGFGYYNTKNWKMQQQYHNTAFVSSYSPTRKLVHGMVKNFDAITGDTFSPPPCTAGRFKNLPNNCSEEDPLLIPWYPYTWNIQLTDLSVSFPGTAIFWNMW